MANLTIQNSMIFTHIKNIASTIMYLINHFYVHCNI